MSIRRPAVPSPKIADALAIEAVASPVRGVAALKVAGSRAGPSPRRVASTAGPSAVRSVPSRRRPSK